MDTRKSFTGTLAALAALASAATSLSACGTAQTWPQPSASIEIYDRTDGRVLPTYMFEGRRYVVGKPGNEYAIRVCNTTAGRVLTVMSVDGVNVISGDNAAPNQTGYVLAPYEGTDISGWRKSTSRTAAFYFTTLGDAYSTRTGRPDNVGVIGVAVFRERPRPIAREEPMRKDVAKAESDSRVKPASSAAGGIAYDNAAPAAQPSIGTGYGRSETSYISYTQFERASDTPDETIAIYYDSYANLLAQGVPVPSQPLARARPEPFPDRGRFVPAP